MNSPINPLTITPAFTNARDRVQRGDLGQFLAMYAVVRAKEPVAEAVEVLGLPLIQELIAVAREAPVSVTALRGEGGSGFEQWSVILGFSSGVRASVDIGAGLGVAQVKELDLRVEWSGTEQAIVVDPTNVAVTVTSARGQQQLSAEINPVAKALFEFGAQARAIMLNPAVEWAVAAAVVNAIGESATTNRPVTIPGFAGI